MPCCILAFKNFYSGKYISSHINLLKFLLLVEKSKHLSWKGIFRAVIDVFHGFASCNAQVHEQDLLAEYLLK